jgi:hypothetical protein
MLNLLTLLVGAGSSGGASVESSPLTGVLSTSRGALLAAASTNFIRLRRLRDTGARSYPADASVTCTLYNAAGTTPIAGASSVSMPFVVGSSGRSSEYRGVLTSDVALAIGTTYLLKARAVDAAGNVHVFQLACLAVEG